MLSNTIVEIKENKFNKWFMIPSTTQWSQTINIQDDRTLALAMVLWDQKGANSKLKGVPV